MARTAFVESLLIDGKISPGWKSVFVAVLALILGPSALLGTTFGILASGLERETGWSHASVATGATMVSLMLMISAPVQGYLIDRIGARRVVLVSLPCFGLALMLLSLGQSNLWAFYTMCALASFAGLGLWPTSFIQIMASWFERRLGIVVGIITSGISISTMLLPVLLPISFAHFRWGYSYAILGCLVLLLVWPACFRWLHPSPNIGQQTEKVSNVERFAASFTEAFRSPALWLVIAMFTMLGFANASLLVHGIAIGKSHGISSEHAVKLYPLIGIGLFLGRIGTGWLLDRMNVRNVLFLAFLILFANYAIWLSEYAASFAGVALLCGGLVVGAEFDILGVMIARNFHASLFGRLYGVNLSAFSIGNAFGAISIALFASADGSFDTMIFWLAGASLGFAMSAWSLKPDRKFSGEPDAE